MNIKNKNVLIIGPPASGKTTLASKLHEQNPLHQLIHSDDYMVHGYKEALYVMMADIRKGYFPQAKASIIEGVQGYRLLRKGVELETYYPDLVIELQVSRERQAQIYADERDASKLKYLQGFDKMHQKILNDYFELVGESKPEWIKMNLNI